MATDVATSAVEDAAAEHALACELARPQGRFRLSVADGAGVRRIVGDRDYRYPRRWVGRGMTVPATGHRRPVRHRQHNGASCESGPSGVADWLVPNALTHGRPPVRFRLWSAPDRIVATVTDRGDGPADPFAGLLPVSDTCSAGLGLWLTHQLCSHVTLDTTDDGFTIRLIVGTPQPGRSGHAPDTA